MTERIFVGRKKELESLRRLTRKKTASLVVIHGRRRIGKSRLAKEFSKSYRFLNFSGLPPHLDLTLQNQLDEFMRQLSRAVGLPELKVNDWSNAFDLLAREVSREVANGPTVILLDEISWMGSKDPNFLGKLKNSWDMALSENPQLILILCGSVSVWIEENILSSTGFMGRISQTIHLGELLIEECQQLLIALGSKANAYEQFKLLSVTGGIPRYIEEIEVNVSADENIRSLCFTSGGMLFKEYSDIFNDLFSTKSAYYQKILSFLVEGDLRFDELCEKLNVQRSGFWLNYIDELIKAGFVSRDFTWNILSGKQSALSRYRLSDNYVRFYLKYIVPNKSNVEAGKFDSASIQVLPGWESILSLQFENLVLNNRRLIWDFLKLHPEDIIADGPYFQKKSLNKSGCQIDYLIKTRFNTLYLCEVKFSRDLIKSDVIKSVETKIEALVKPQKMACMPVLIHVNGVSSSVESSRFFSHLIDFSDFISAKN